MANTVFIRFHTDYSVDWIVSANDSGIPAQSGKTLEDAGKICHGKKIVIYLPGSMAHLGTHLIPARSRQKILQAAPFAMEDDLIGDIDDFHFAIPTRTPANNIPICAITHEGMETILTLLQDHDIKPQAMLAETLVLPWQQKAWTVLIEDDKTTVRTGQYAGFTVDTNNLYDYFDIALQEAGDELPAKLNIMDYRSLDQGEALDKLVPDSFKTRLELDDTTPQQPVIETLVASYRDTDGINMMQGNYAVKNIRHQSWKKWYPAAAALLVLLILKSVGGAIEYYQLSSESELLDKQIKQIFRQSMPDVKRIVDPREQMLGRLKTLQAGNQGGRSGFFTYFSHSARALGSDQSISVKTLNYRNNRLDIELNISDLQALEKLKQQITQAGSRVDIRSAAVEGKQVSARLRLHGSGS